MTDHHRLPTQLEAVLIRLCRRCGPLAKTRAVKLPYLVDLVARRRLGRPITEGTHQTWDYGVVTREVYRFISHGTSTDPFVIEDHPFSEGGVQIRLQGDARDGLAPEETQIVDGVAEAYGSLDAFSLGAMTKSLNTDLEPSAWGSNHEAGLGEEAYGRLSSTWRDLFQKLQVMDLDDESQWSEPITDTGEHLRRALYG